MVGARTLGVQVVGAMHQALLTVILDPGSWSLDHFGQILVATVKNGKTFQWSPINSEPNALTTRAAIVNGAPTKSVMSIVSERDRHLIILGTETTIGDSTKQDPMFIRFSDQEDISITRQIQ
jgi:hypothetical protein